MRRSGSTRKAKENLKKSQSTNSLASSESEEGVIREDESMEDELMSDGGGEDDDIENNDDNGEWFEDDENEEQDNEPTFTILPKEGLVRTQQEIIDTVISQVSLSAADTALLLQYFNWNTEKLLRDYFEKPDFFQKEAGIYITPVGGSSGGSSSSTPAKVGCLVCFETVPSERTYTLNCGHKWYCTDCWKEYLHEQTTKSGPQVVNTRCMYPKCPAKVNSDVFKRMADPRDYTRYQYFFTKNFVESDKHLAFCPNPTCGNAVKFHGVGRPTDVVECTCSSRFCFSCGREHHSPVSCKILEMWRLRNEDDQESVRLIQATSKPCHHCGMPTERTQGCNHMTCRKEQGGCGGEWCWMCRGDWKTHGQHTGGFYSCNKYEASDAKKVDDDAAALKADSDKFLHYFHRYFDHDVLNKQAESKKKEVQAKMEQFRELTSQNPDFLLEAADLLIECRRILKYTYAYGFYLQDGPPKHFFEHLQGNAEGITERLSELLAAPVSQINPEDLKNRIRVTKKYTANLVKGIEEGLGVEGMKVQ